jgi:hypothetical protein
MMHVPNEYRLVHHPILGSTEKAGNNGAFDIPYSKNYRDYTLIVVASDGGGWEHVSVSIMGKPNQTPTWEMMCFVKDLFWDDEDVVMQFHPPKSQYVDNHPGCLHMWRPIGKEVLIPPSIFVGLK